jgi:hypothetical protein
MEISNSPKAPNTSENAVQTPKATDSKPQEGEGCKKEEFDAMLDTLRGNDISKK